MTIEIKVPSLGESVTEATVAKWLKQPGEAIERDEPVVELETDKVTLEVPAPAARPGRPLTPALSPQAGRGREVARSCRAFPRPVHGERGRVRGSHSWSGR